MAGLGWGSSVPRVVWCTRWLEQVLARAWIVSSVLGETTFGVSKVWWMADLSRAYLTVVLFYYRKFGVGQDLSISILVWIHIDRINVGVIQVWSYDIWSLITNGKYIGIPYCQWICHYTT